MLEVKGLYGVRKKITTIKLVSFFTALADGDHNVLCCNSFKIE